MKETLCPFLESIFSQIDSRFEVVICDGCSTDGSREILEYYAREGKIKLSISKSSRGKGRQLAFLHSQGKYIISGLDADDILKPALAQILNVYHSGHEGYVLSYGTIHFIPRSIAISVGGWRDLQYFEDVDFCKRIKALGKLHYFEDDSIIVEKKGRVRRNFSYRVKERFSYYTCGYQVGRNIMNDILNKKFVSLYRRPVELILAFTAITVAKIRKIKSYEYL